MQAPQKTPEPYSRGYAGPQPLVKDDPCKRRRKHRNRVDQEAGGTSGKRPRTGIQRKVVGGNAYGRNPEQARKVASLRQSTPRKTANRHEYRGGYGKPQ